MPEKTRLLLTNDDGLDSPGLTTLATELLKTGRFELRLAAPAKEQSGVGHAITLHQPLFAETVKLDGALAEVPTCRVAGTPADCVKLAITNLFPDFKPDLVLSGINRGPNVGINVLYSGTVAGALEAAINGLPAMALSLDVPAGGLWHFALASELSVPIVDAAVAHGLPPWTALNVNYPNIAQEKIRGTRLTHQGYSGFKEYYIEEPAEEGRRKFRLEGDMVFRDEDQRVDAVAIRDGWISISALGLKLTDAAFTKDLASWPIFSEHGP